MRALHHATFVIAALVCASCAQTTQIVIVVDSDLMLTRVDIQVSSTHSPPTHAIADFSMAATPRLPLTLAVYPRASADIDVLVIVTGTTMSGTTIERDVRTHFVSGSSRMLRVLLAARCLNLACAAGATCDETGCRAVAIGGDALPPWSGSAPSLNGMAACAAVDETCNGRDDDCDMQVDEGFHLATDAMNCGTCGHACTSGACTNGFCAGESITHLASGGAHVCAASMSGTLTCWGWNDQQELGPGNEAIEANAAPTHVASVTSVAAVAAGALHTCTVDTSGRCACFGDGESGELGRGTRVDSAMPLSVAGAMTFTSVAAGVSATCAIDSMHRLLCWGANEFGQLGDGTTTPSSMPAGMVVFPDGALNVNAVAIGWHHACAVRMDGTLWCWGANDLGQLGPGVGAAPGIPIQVPGIADAIAVACGREFTCVVHRTGAIDCFGADDQGQLGSGMTMPSSPTPLRVMSVSDATSVSAASAGTHACAVRMSGLLACWGGNASGQLGDGTTMPRNAPVMIAMPTDASAVAAGGIAADGTGHTCALDHEGRVWCWGDGALGQLGTGDYLSRNRPTLVLGAM